MASFWFLGMRFYYRRTARALFLSVFLCVSALFASADLYAQVAGALRVDPSLLGGSVARPAEPEVKPLKPIDSSLPSNSADDSASSPSASSSNAPVEPQTKPTGKTPATLPPVKSAETTTPTPVVPFAPVEPQTKPTDKTPATLPPVKSAETTPPTPVVPIAPTAPSVTPEALPPKATNNTASSPSRLGVLRVDPALLGGAPVVAETKTIVRREQTAQTIKPVGQAAQTAQTLPVPDTSKASPNAPARLAKTAPPSRDEPALALRPSKKMSPLPKESDPPYPVFLQAERVNGSVDREVVAEGDAELRKVGSLLTADRMTYWVVDDEVEAEGNAHLEQGNDRMDGPKMRLRMGDRVGFVESPVYAIKRQPKGASPETSKADFVEQPAAQDTLSYWLNSGFAATQQASIHAGQVMLDPDSDNPRKATSGQGKADRLEFTGENQYQLTNSTYSTCKPGQQDWYIKTSDLHLDYDLDIASGHNGTVYFMDVPIFYSPWFSFSLNDERKSGFLAPSIGSDSESGLHVTVPYYWNIAPNMDATSTVTHLGKRGVMLDNEVRYLNTAWGGVYNTQAKFDFLPDDKMQGGENRWGVALQHAQTTANGFTAAVNYNKVSDNTYFTDLASGVTSTATTQLLQQATLTYGGGGWWSATANFQQYQTLQPDPAVSVVAPYKLLPQFTLNARKPDLYGADGSFMGQITHFAREDSPVNAGNNPTGVRSVLYPQVALPFVTHGWYVTPKVGLNIRHYSLDGIWNNQAVAPSQSITLPIFSVDSGMVFERPSQWFGREYTQTLEPRLYYVNIPYKNQDTIPTFDSGLSDFNFAQIFTENQFAGWDRINNANQLTAALTNRLLDPTNGDEIMRLMVGQRYYFARNKVDLAPSAVVPDDNTKWQRSDWLAAFSGQILPKVYVDTAMQYSVAGNQLQRFSVGTRFHPEPGKALNAAYRYNRDAYTPIDQIDVSGQWPLWGRWYGVGRVNYSLKDDGANFATDTKQKGRVVEAIGGIEYDGGCWVVRGVVQRLALTQDKTSSAFFIQLELNDFVKVGSNPLELLKRNIQGYRLINRLPESTANDY